MRESTQFWLRISLVVTSAFHVINAAAASPAKNWEDNNNQHSDTSLQPIEDAQTDQLSALINAKINPVLLSGKPFNPEDTYHKVESDGIQLLCVSSNPKMRSSSKHRLMRCRPQTKETNTRALSFQQVVLRSILLNPEVLATQYDVESQLWLVRQSFSSWYPTVGLTSGSLLLTNITNTQNYSSGASTPSNPSTAGTAFEPSVAVGNARSGSRFASKSSNQSSNTLVTPYTQYANYLQAYPVLTMSWNLFDTTRNPNIFASKYALSASEYQLLAAARQSALNTSMLYAQMVTAEYQIAGFYVQLKSSIKQLRYLRKRYKQKLTTKSDLYQQESLVAQIKSQLVAAISSYQSNLKQLLVSLNLKDIESATYFFPQDLLVPNQWPLDLKRTQDLIHSNPSVLVYSAQSKETKAQADASFYSYWPKLSVLGYLTYVGTSGSQSYFPPSQPNGAWSNQFSSYIGLNLTWSFFDGFSAYQQSKSLYAQALSLEKQAENQELIAQSTALANIETLNHSSKAINVLVNSIELANIAKKSLEKRFYVGLDSPTNMIEMEQQIGELYISYANLYGSISSAWLQLLQLTGLQLEHNIIADKLVNKTQQTQTQSLN